jgi:putative membrane protein
MYPGHMWFGGGWMMFPWLFLLILVVLVILFMGRSGRPFGSSSEQAETPLEILKKRYARGEISKEEFEEMKKNIS